MAFKKTFILSDESVNAYGFVVKTDGIQLDAAVKNLPCFYDHKTWETPLGHWENLRKENGKLLGDLVIVGDNDREKGYISKIESGDIKGASIGADPIVWNSDATQLAIGQTRPTLEKCLLFEASITPLPGNTNALALRHEGGLINLSQSNHDFLPVLQKLEPNMKAIALKLGLPETATESEIIAKIGEVQLARTSAESFMEGMLKDADKDLTEEQKEIFVELKRANPLQAIKYVELSKPKATGKLTKDVKVSELIRLNKADKPASDKEQTYDYLQKHDPVELKRIHKEEPELYAELAKDYANGVRHKD